MSQSITSTQCHNCWTRPAAENVSLDGWPACTYCKRIAQKRGRKLVRGIFAAVNTSLPSVKAVASLPGQLDLFGEGE